MKTPHDMHGCLTRSSGSAICKLTYDFCTCSRVQAIPVFQLGKKVHLRLKRSKQQISCWQIFKVL